MNNRLKILLVLLIFISANACLLIKSETNGIEILDLIPVYPGAKFINESRTGYPDSTPSVIRTYESDAAPKEILAYYEQELKNQNWIIQASTNSDNPVPKEILADKNSWRISVLVYMSGRFTLRIFLN